MRKLDREKETVAYSRGRHFVLAFEAVARLREKGLTAQRLQDGFPEWQLAGFPDPSSNTNIVALMVNSTINTCA